MPGNMTKPEEKYWKESKTIIKDQKGKSQKKFKDRDWAIVQKIFQAKKKKHLAKGKGKNKKADLLADMLKFASFLDNNGHFKLANAVDDFVKIALVDFGVDDGEE